MACKLMFIPNDDTQNYLLWRLEYVVENLDTQLNELTIEFLNNLQSCKANKQENVNVKLWGLV